MDKNKGMEESALFVMDGVEATSRRMQYGVHPKSSERKGRHLNVGELAQQVRVGSRTIKSHPSLKVQTLPIKYRHKNYCRSFFRHPNWHNRCVPAGKSSFIEAFGTMLCDMGKRVAVLAIDPSSSIGRKYTWR